VPVKTRRRQRARVGEQPAQGEVRPVTNRTLLVTGLAVLLLVAAATTAILAASAGTKPRVTSTTNTPHGLQTPTSGRSYAGTYQETAELPSKREIVSATVTLECAQACSHGRYTGYAGAYAVTVKDSQLSGTVHTACQDLALVLTSDSSLATPAPLPQSLTGTLTRTATCAATDVASPVSLRLHRTR
jgi:hypothetical protein